MHTENIMTTGIGIAGMNVPPEYQAMVRSFTGVATKCEYIAREGRAYCKVLVSKDNGPDCDDRLDITCLSYEEVEPGQTVSGLTCKMNRGVLEGIIFPSYYEPLLELNDFDSLIDSMARDFYMEYYEQDYRRINEFFQAKFVNGEDGSYCTGESVQSILLRAARVTKCNFKGARKYVLAKYALQDDDTEIERYLERYYEPGSVIYILLFRGMKDQMLHTFSLNGIFEPILRTYHELFERFFNDRLFLLMCEVIYNNSKTPIDPNVPVRVMITNTPKIKEHLCVFGRPLSANYPQVADYGTNGFQNTDSIVRTDNQTFITGKIYIMTAQTAGDRYKLRPYRAPDIIEPKPAESPVMHSETEDSTKAVYKAVLNNDEGEKKEVEATAAGDLTLLAIHPNEYSVMPQTSKRGFDARYLQILVEDGKVWKFHYDILHWIRYLEFSNVILMQNLISAGYINGSYQDCALSETKQKQIDSFKAAKENIRKGWEDDVEVDFKIIAAIPKFSKILSDMFEWGLLDSLRFQNEDGKTSMSIIYKLSSKGSTLLQRMNRRTRRDNEFAFARSPIDIKSILSGNQLYVAYLCNLKGYVNDKESHVRMAFFTESASSRPKFDLVFRYGEKKLNIWGESIRGYIGASKEYHLHDMYGKIERYKKTIDFLRQNNGERYCLVLVCQSYSSMKETSALVSSALDSEWTCPVLLTYDIAAIGRFSESHFLLDLPTGQIQKVRDITDYFKGLTV